MNKTALLFDLDGTVFDTAPEFLHCMNIILEQHRRPPITLPALREQVSNGGNAMVKLGFGVEPSDPSFGAIKEAFLTTYQQHLGTKCQPFDGMMALFDHLDTQHIPWAVVTNKPSQFAFPTLEQFGLKPRAHAIVCADQVSQPKPSAEPLLAACKQLQIEPQHCWYIGDALIDVRASKAANMPVAIAKYGYFPKGTDIDSWNADFYFEHPTELIPHVNQLLDLNPH